MDGTCNWCHGRWMLAQVGRLMPPATPSDYKRYGQPCRFCVTALNRARVERERIRQFAGRSYATRTPSFHESVLTAAASWRP
jgi:hypothetical protein